jgi:hypothetical protein
MAKNYLIIVVSIVWTATIGVSAFNPSFQVNPAIHGIFGIIVGAVFGVDVVKKKD